MDVRGKIFSLDPPRLQSHRGLLPELLLFEGQHVFIFFLENVVDGVQQVFVLDGEVVFVFLVHGLHLQDDHVGLGLVGGQEDQVFFGDIDLDQLGE